MRARRYTIVVADHASGVVRRGTISLRPFASAVAFILMLPCWWPRARWSARVNRSAAHDQCGAGNRERGYRVATGELTTQIQSLENVINDRAIAPLDPAQARACSGCRDREVACDRRQRATERCGFRNRQGRLSTPEDTFGVLKDLLKGLESRLSFVRRDVEQRQALSGATPSIWPTHGWLTGTFGGRSDPFSHEPAFHQGLDISTDKGESVVATADGTVDSASYTGDYGNLVVIRHAFGLATRYGHLSAFNVQPGQQVKRNDVIGFVGATGRATGYHLHYEILANGKLLNPLQLLTQPAAR